jgi:hypothetical protein
MSATLVSRLRARPGIVQLEGAGGDGSTITVRVQVAEVWDAVRVAASPSARVIEVKRRALAELLREDHAGQDYVVKLRGHEVLDETVSLQDAGVRDGSTLLVTNRRRCPVR